MMQTFQQWFDCESQTTRPFCCIWLCKFVSAVAKFFFPEGANTDHAATPWLPNRYAVRTKKKSPVDCPHASIHQAVPLFQDRVWWWTFTSMCESELCGLGSTLGSLIVGYLKVTVITGFEFFSLNQIFEKAAESQRHVGRIQLDDKSTWMLFYVLGNLMFMTISKLPNRLTI